MVLGFITLLAKVDRFSRVEVFELKVFTSGEGA